MLRQTAMSPVFVVLLVEVIFMTINLETATATFNYTKCPAVRELQSDAVKKTFNLTKFAGTYYELALHDYTQYPLCPSPTCMQSNKVVDYKLKQINDTFYLNCLGHKYPNALHLNITDTPGHFNGTWTFVPGILFSHTVVDVYENSDGVYEWVIEFQCVEKLGRVWFIGINWYCRKNIVSDAYLENMLKAARTRGLGFFMDSGEKVFKVEQKNCTYMYA